MMEAIFKHGQPLMIDYTPVAAVAAGQVIPGSNSGITSFIAHHDIEANTRGAVAAGGGVYEVVNSDNSADNVRVYWDNATKKVTATATGNALIGYIVRDGGRGVNSTCYVKHSPDG